MAVEARSPLAKGVAVRLRGPWREPASVTIDSFDVMSGRIVGVLSLAVPADTGKSPTSAVGLAYLIDSDSSRTAPVTPPASTPNDSTINGATPSSCVREWDDATRARATSVRDSLERVLKAGDPPIYARLRNSLRTRRSMIAGCFPGGNAVIAVALYGGDYEWVREKVVLLTESGAAKALTVRDYRMRAHELLDAFDADDNGTDDVAARGFTERAGAQVVLRFSDNKLERIAAGFAWER
jgi:hypothetical protein